MDDPNMPDDAPPPEAEQREFEFEEPKYLDDDELESLEKESARQRRRMTRSDRRTAKKAAKIARYPVKRCVIAADWADQRFGPIAMIRKRPDDEVAFGSGIVDLGALGLKDGFFEASIPRRRGDEMIERVQSMGAELEECDPAVASKVLRHATAFAKKCGIDPPTEYFALRKFFGVSDLSDVDVEVPLGHRGKPVLIPGPHDDVEELVETLEDELGRNGFYLGAPSSGPTSNASADSQRGGAGDRASAPTPPDPSAPLGVDDEDDESGSDIIMPGDF